MREYHPTKTSKRASVQVRGTGAGKETDGHLVVVSELRPSIEVIETPVGRLEMDSEGRREILGHVQEIVDMTREVVVGHRRRQWRERTMDRRRLGHTGQVVVRRQRSAD